MFVRFTCMLAAAVCLTPAQPVIDLARSPQARVRNIPLNAVKMGDGFWSSRRAANVQVSIPTLLDEYEKRGIIDNFRRISSRKKVDRRGPLFTDSDVYKWLEAVAYTRDPKLLELADAVIDDVAAAQEPSGYINTYYSAERRSERHSNMRHGHELYCGGHLIQAGIAHHRATGSRKLLDLGIRFADYVLGNFGRDKKPIIEGHPEMEMALIELYRTTGEQKYLDFARYLLEGDTERIPLSQRDLVYLFTGKPFIAREGVEGHSVRAMYASSGAADLYLETGDPAYWETLQTLWTDMATRKVYITGGVGSRAQGEAFGEPYELPNQLAYTESCAAIANMMWNWRMLAATGEAKYADMVERTLYNGVNAGLSLSGNLYCYRNPLELTGNPNDKIRNPWYDTTCCPPNLERVLASLPGYLYGAAKDGVYVHLYHASELDWNGIKLTQSTDYPWTGEITVRVGAPRQFAMYLRIPAWSAKTQVTVNGKPVQANAGEYARIERNWLAGDTVQLRLDVQPRLTAADPRVRDNIGKVAVEKGPLVYCAEGLDQTAPIWESVLVAGARMTEQRRGDLLGGVTVIKAKAVTRQPAPSLYGPLMKANARPSELTLIPYYTFANREATPMAVWLPYMQ